MNLSVGLVPLLFGYDYDSSRHKDQGWWTSLPT